MNNIDLKPELFEIPVAADEAKIIVAQEQQILGYLLHTSPQNVHQIFEKLSANHFFFKPHRIIFDTCDKAFLLKKEVDIVWVSEYLQHNQKDCKGFAHFFDNALDYNVNLARETTISSLFSFESKANHLLSFHYKQYLDQALKENNFEAVAKYNSILQSLQNKTSFSIVKDLLNKPLEMLHEIIENLLYEGVTILAGKPKLGKSWLMLELAVAVSSGGVFLGTLPIIKSGAVLYCALEDNERTLQNRLNIYLQNNRMGHHDIPDNFSYAIQGSIKKVNEGGISQLEQWCKQANNPRLIIIDTMKCLKPTTKQIGYESDYDATQPYRELVDKYGVSILLVHHTRKAEANNDPLDAISGSVGLSGSVDSLMVLNRARHENAARLFVTGRLMHEQDIALSFNNGVWEYLGDGQLADANALERKILECISLGLNTPALIAKEVDAKLGTVSKQLRRMLDKTLIKQSDYGKYQLIND